MSFLFGGGGNASSKAPAYTAVQIQTSINTLPIPVGWGTFLLAPNLIWYGDFKKHKKKVGGKGVGGKSGSIDDYTASVELALCEGPIDSIPTVIVGQGKSTLSDLGMSLLLGTYPTQAAWDYLTHAHSADAFGYPGTTIVAVENYDLGPSASLQNHNFVTVRTTGFLAPWCAPSGIATADMALVIEDFFSSEQYGVPGFASSFDSVTLLSTADATTTGDASLQTYLRAQGIGMCPALNSQETASSILDRWLQLCNCAPVWSGDVLKFIPYGDETITGHGVTYLPNLTPIGDLDDDDYLDQPGDTPIAFSRTDPADAKNVEILEVTTEDGNFAFLPIPAWDQSAIENSLTRKMDGTITAHEIVGTEVGAIVVQLILQKQLYNRNSATFKLPITFCHYDPMDVVTATARLPGGDYTVDMRLTSIEEDDSGDLTVEADELRIGVGTAVSYAKAPSTGTSVNSLAPPTSVNTPIIFEPNSALVSVPEVWIAVCGGGGAFDPNWGGCQVWLSVDDDTYAHVGDIGEPARMGVLTSSLALFGGANPDTADTLTVDLSESDGELLSGSSDDAENARTLCYVDGELLSYETATLSTATATAEAHDVPAVAPYAVNVANAATFSSDGGVSYAGGAALTLVRSNPAAGEYSVDADGLYTFNVADAGASIEITYDYASSWHYDLDNLWRGQFGTTAGAHLSGTAFARLDGTILRFQLPSDYIGKLIYVKLCSFNIFGSAIEDISTVTAYTYMPSGAGIPAGGAASSGSHTVTSGEAAAHTATVAISCDSDATVTVSIYRAGALVTGDASIMVSPGTSGSIVVADGATYVLTTGDAISWSAISGSITFHGGGVSGGGGGGGARGGNVYY